MDRTQGRNAMNCFRTFAVAIAGFRKVPCRLLALAVLSLTARSALALDTVFPVALPPPAGWALSALNGMNAPDLGSTGPDVLSADGANRLRIRAGTIYSSPYTTNASISPGSATNLEYKYDLTGFAGNEIALGTRF